MRIVYDLHFTELFPKDFVKQVVNGKTVSEFNIVIQSWIKNIVDQNNKLKKKDTQKTPLPTDIQQISTFPEQTSNQNAASKSESTINEADHNQFIERDFETNQNLIQVSNSDGTYNIYANLSPVFPSVEK